MNNPSPRILCATGEIDGELAEVTIVLAVDLKTATNYGQPFPDYCDLRIEFYHSLVQDGKPTPWVGLHDSLRYQKNTLPMTDEELLEFAILELPATLNRIHRIKISQPIRDVPRNHFMLQMLRHPSSADALRCLHESRSEEVRSLHKDFFTLKSTASKFHTEAVQV